MSDLQSHVLQLNKQALDSLRMDDFSSARELLKRAESRLSDCEANVKSITLNNLGCYYRRKKQLNVAGYFLRKALHQSIDSLAQAGVHLNLCTILSASGKHEAALKQAMQALELAQNSEEKQETRLTTEIIGYQNAGVELEFLGRLGEAVEMYAKGETLAKEKLGPTHGLSEQLTKCKTAALTRFRAVNDFTEMRKSYRWKDRVPTHTERSLLLPSLSRKLSNAPAHTEKNARKRLGSLPLKSRVNSVKGDSGDWPQGFLRQHPYEDWKGLGRTKGHRSVLHHSSIQATSPRE